MWVKWLVGGSLNNLGFNKNVQFKQKHLNAKTNTKLCSFDAVFPIKKF